MRPLLLTVALTAAGTRAQNTLKMPVQIDESGKTVYLTTTESSDVLFEALRFCAEHLPSLELDECARNLAAEEAAMRAKSAVDRQTAQASLPGITFTVQSPEGAQLRFTHEEGSNPADEARLFCAEHFGDVPESACVEHMMRNAQAALDEATAASVTEAQAQRDEL